MANLYDIIADLRRRHQTPSASRTLDMVVGELGQTQDNLRLALARLEGRPVPVGGKEVLEELAGEARAAGVDENETPISAAERKAALEPVDASQRGIALMLGGSAALSLLLVVIVIVVAVQAILKGG